MSKLSTESIVTMLMIICIWPLTCWATEPTTDKWQLVATQSMENCFGDRPVLCQFQLTGPARQSVRVQWQVMIERRVWQRGSVRVITDAGDKASEVAFEFRAPPVNAGVIAGGKLRLQLSDEEHDDLLTEEFPLWIFHANPFDTEFAWLKQLPFELLDPENKLAGRLKELAFPGKLDGSELKNKRVLIVAQMTTWDAAVTQRIDQTLHDGGRVLCLAVTNGTLRPSSLSPTQSTSDSLGQTTNRLQLPDVRAANLKFVRQLDARLSSEQLAVTSRGRIEYGPDERLSLTIQNNHSGWAFVEAGFDVSPAWVPDHKTTFTVPKVIERPRLVYCGVDLMSRWSESPAPRYLFVNLLARLCFEPEINSTSKDLP